jgi:hypothetical protein
MLPEVHPIPKAVYLCDDVVPDAETGKVHLLGVFNAARPAGGIFPYRLDRLCVFAQLVGGPPEAPMHIEVVRAETDEVAYASPTYSVRFPTRLTTTSVCIRVRGCPFPAPGVYLVELYCSGVFLDDRSLHLLAPQGDAP